MSLIEREMDERDMENAYTLGYAEGERRIAELEAQVTRLQNAVQESFAVKQSEWAGFDQGVTETHLGLQPGDLDSVGGDA